MVQRPEVPTLARRSAATDPAEDLPRIQAGGFGATVEACAYEDDPGNPGQRRLWLVSMVASRQATDAIWSALVGGKGALLSLRGFDQVRPCVLAPEGPRGWPAPVVKLRQSQLSHCLIHPRSAGFGHDRTDFLLIPRLDPRGAEAAADPTAAERAREELVEQYFRFLNRRVDTPLHPSWAAWLWERALRREEAVELASYGLAAYRCTPDLAALAVDVPAAVADGTLTVCPTDGDETEAVRRGAGVVPGLAAA